MSRIEKVQFSEQREKLTKTFSYVELWYLDVSRGKSAKQLQHGTNVLKRKISYICLFIVQIET